MTGWKTRWNGPRAMADSLQTDMMTMAGLNLIQQALTIYDRDLQLVICNQRFRDMFNLPDALCTPGAGFEDTIRHLVTRGEYGPVEDVEAAVQARVETAMDFKPHYMERTRSNGRMTSEVWGYSGGIAGTTSSTQTVSISPGRA